MFSRKELANIVVWPTDNKGQVNLLTPEGEVIGGFPFREPFEGHWLSDFVPGEMLVDFENAAVVSTAMRRVVSTVGKFDTAVVSERAGLSFEERIARIERSDRLRSKALKEERNKRKQLEEELNQLRKNGEGDEVTEPDPEKPQDTPAEPPQGGKRDQDEGGKQDDA